MQTDPTRRTFVAGGAAAGIAAVAGCAGGDESGDENGDAERVRYEIWALDQGKDDIYLYRPAGGDEFERAGRIDLNELEGVPSEGVVPHLIDYSSDYGYAAVACTGGARVLVFRTEDRELVGNVETGPSSHAAVFSPDDEYVHVDVIGDEAVARVEADLENETFAEVDRLVLPEDETVRAAGIDSARPICHQFDGRGRSLHALGPSYDDAGLVVVDHEAFAVETAFSRAELPTNIGTMPHYAEEKFYLAAGRPETDDEAGRGEYYVLDTAADEVVERGDTGGIDAHGFWYTPDGEELWVLNRGSDDGAVIDPETDEVIDEIDDYGPTPDGLWASPDGEYMFVTLRGPEPQSAARAAEGKTPGFNVLDVASREIVTTVEPDPIGDYSDEELEDESTATPDFHGIGVRPIDDVDSAIPTSPPF